MLAQRIVIVGLGLMGSSLARALAALPSSPHLAGVDVSAETRAIAADSGLFDAVLPDLAAAEVAANDLVVLATPVRAILTLLADLPHTVPHGCLLLDLGSTKAQICAAMDSLGPAFAVVGGHPMCGKEVDGFAHGSADLYREQTFILTPTAHTPERALTAATALAEAVGAQPLLLDPSLHDELVAAVSHVPYVTSALLMALVAQQAGGAPHLWQVAASGFRDASRLAGSNPTMMGDIVATNREAIGHLLRAYRDQLTMVLGWLDSADNRALSSWMQAVHDAHAAYRDAQP